ncbi:MAG TPA: hypothetical protein VD651_02545 [Nitrosarchaeum sp.]|nr:hypothetical protein [Nitrosarchaeum sp.]
MNEIDKIQCDCCGSFDAIIVSDERYHGLRGICPDCGSNWPES